MKVFKCDRDTEGRRKIEKFVGKKSRILSQIINKLNLFELNLICIFSIIIHTMASVLFTLDKLK